MAILPSFDSFFSSYSRKPEKGYSGTCIFTRRSLTVPIKAEEGISGLLPLDRKPEPTQDELIGGTLGPESIALNMQDVKTIDLEGRTTMVDLGLFVLINVYCPNETNEERLDFKLAFNAMLEARILNLIRLGREVIVLGDLNICRSPLDHCDPVRRMKDSSYAEFGDHPARKWFNEFIAPNTGTMIDLGRHFYPDRKSMFTHWETRINARETNYGSRIDYILATPGLLPWIKTCDIQPSILGSDHCPVTADFHETITTANGEIKHLWDHINIPGRSKDTTATPPDPPRLAARNYPEFSSEQRLLSNFFGKKPGGQSQSTSTPGATPIPRANSATSIHRKAGAKTTDVEADTSDALTISATSGDAEPGVNRPEEALLHASKPSSAASIAQHAQDAASAQSSEPKMPAASPSIDLTLDQSDSGSDIGTSKKRPMLSNGTSQSARIPKRTKSSSATPVPGGSSSEKSISKVKTKKGQGTLAAFFRPPASTEPIVKNETKEVSLKSDQGSPILEAGDPAQAVDNSRKMQKGKMRGSVDMDPEIVQGNQGFVLSSDDEETQAAYLPEADDGMENLRKLATKGSRVVGTSSPRRAKRKERERSSGTSTDSDVQEVC